MKQLSFLLCLTALAISAFSCKKDKDLAIGKFHTPCETVLDNWSIKVFPLPETQRQNDLFFINEEMGFTVGNAGTILKTSNGGNDWDFVERYYDLTTNSIVPGALTKARLVTVFFVNAAIGYAGGEGENTPISGENIDAVLLKTKDGGDTWSKQYLPGIRAVKDLHFFDADNGLALFLLLDENNYLKQKIFATYDGGASWEPIPMPNLTVSSPQFDTGQASVGVWVVENYHSSKYLRSNDQGATWQEIQIPSTECNAIQFESEAVGFAACDGKHYKTNDGGNSWEEITDPTLNGATLTHFTSDAEGFGFVPVFDFKTGGGEGWQELNSFEVYQTTDGGLNWKNSVIEKDCDFTGRKFAFSSEVFYTLGWQAVNKFTQR